MLEEIGTKIGIFFCNKGYLDEEDIDAFRFEFEYIISEYVSILLTLLVAYFFHQFWQCALYLVAFIFLRNFYPGYHCKTFLTCNVLSTLLCIEALCIISFKPKFVLLLELVSSLIFASYEKKFSPVALAMGIGITLPHLVGNTGAISLITSALTQVIILSIVNKRRKN